MKPYVGWDTIDFIVFCLFGDGGRGVLGCTKPGSCSRDHGHTDVRLAGLPTTQQLLARNMQRARSSRDTMEMKQHSGPNHLTR